MPRESISTTETPTDEITPAATLHLAQPHRLACSLSRINCGGSDANAHWRVFFLFAAMRRLGDNTTRSWAHESGLA